MSRYPVTTVVGSYPMVHRTVNKSLKIAVEDQIRAGIELISDGQLRADMIHLFTDFLDGINDMLEVCGEIRWTKPITLDTFKKAKKIAEGRAYVKGIVTGPNTLLSSLKINENSPYDCLLYTSPSPRDLSTSRMPSSA